MKYFLLILFSVSIYANGNTSKKVSIDLDVLENIRTNCYASVENEDLVEQLERYISKHFTENKDTYPNLILAYIAAIESVKSKHAFWPFTKLNYFKKSMELFKQVVENDPENLEIRFLRFTILHYIPAILGHSAERKADADVIIRQLLKKDYSFINQEIQQGIAEFMIESKRLSKHQERLINSNFIITVNK